MVRLLGLQGDVASEDERVMTQPGVCECGATLVDGTCPNTTHEQDAAVMRRVQAGEWDWNRIHPSQGSGRPLSPTPYRYRQLAEVTARLIARAPEAPDTIGVPPPALRLLAHAYVELRDQVRALHDHVDQTDPNDPIGTALTKVGLERRPADSTTTTSKPRLVPTAAQVASMSTDQLVQLYCRAIGTIDFTKHDTFIVRLWDGMDGCWTDCTGEVSRDEALRVWAERTDGGARCVSYAEIDYYRIFPGGTRMNWDGSDGREMHR